MVDVRRRRDGTGPEKRSLLVHARQSEAAEGIVKGTLAGIRDYRNPVIRLEAAHGILASEDQLRAARREAIDTLRSLGWTWSEIGTVVGVSRQRAFQIGNDL